MGAADEVEGVVGPPPLFRATVALGRLLDGLGVLGAGCRLPPIAARLLCLGEGPVGVVERVVIGAADSPENDDQGGAGPGHSGLPVERGPCAGG